MAAGNLVTRGGPAVSGQAKVGEIITHGLLPPAPPPPPGSRPPPFIYSLSISPENIATPASGNPNIKKITI